jgi:hypothetical protein
MTTSVLINIDGRRLLTGEGRAESHLLGREHEPRAAAPTPEVLQTALSVAATAVPWGPSSGTTITCSAGIIDLKRCAFRGA